MSKDINVQSGWYPDPAPGSLPGSLRFWDGVRWSVETKVTEPKRTGLAGDPNQYLVPSRELFPATPVYSPPAPQLGAIASQQQLNPGVSEPITSQNMGNEGLATGSSIWSKKETNSSQRNPVHVFYISVILVLVGIIITSFIAGVSGGLSGDTSSSQDTGSITANQQTQVAANLNANVDGYVDVAFTTGPSFIAEGMTTPMYGITVYIRAETFSTHAIEQSLVSLSESGIDETVAIDFILQYTNPAGMVSTTLMDTTTVLSTTPNNLTTWKVDAPSGAIVYVEQLRTEVKDKLM